MYFFFKFGTCLSFELQKLLFFSSFLSWRGECVRWSVIVLLYILFAILPVYLPFHTKDKSAQQKGGKCGANFTHPFTLGMAVYVVFCDAVAWRHVAQRLVPKTWAARSRRINTHAHTQQQPSPLCALWRLSVRLNTCQNVPFSLLASFLRIVYRGRQPHWNHSLFKIIRIFLETSLQSMLTIRFVIYNKGTGDEGTKRKS